MVKYNGDEYAKGSCKDCHVIRDKRLLFKYKTTEAAGYSRSASINPFSSNAKKTMRVGGSSYHRYVELLLCEDCLKARKKSKRIAIIAEYLFYAALIYGFVYLLNHKENTPPPPAPDTSVNAPEQTSREAIESWSSGREAESEREVESKRAVNDNLNETEVNPIVSATDQEVSSKDSTNESTPEAINDTDKSTSNSPPIDNQEPAKAVRPCESLKLC